MLRASMSNTSELNTVKSPVKASQALRRHFLSLGRQVVRWADKLTLDSVCIGVTCLDRRIGTSTVSFNLAAAIGKVLENNVLYAEADFGNPFLFRKRGGKLPVGLSDVLKGDVESSSAIVQLEGEPHLSALGCGLTKERDSVELPLGNLKTVVADQLSHFDFVVFDLPIADGLTACDSVASQLDGVILVVESGDIDQRRIESFRNRMNRMNVEIIGLVINKA